MDQSVERHCIKGKQIAECCESGPRKVAKLVQVAGEAGYRFLKMVNRRRVAN